MIRKLFILLCMLYLPLAKAQHDHLYSQYMFSGILINPAYAGSNEVLSATAICRNQWMGFDGAPKTNTFCIHSPLKNKKINFGLVLVNDHYGITTQNSIQAVYAYRIFFKKSSLSFGLQAGINFTQNNFSAIQTTTPGDPVFSGQYSQKNIPQSGFGIYYTSNKFYAGVSAPVLLSIGSPGTVYNSGLLTAGYLIQVGENIRIKPSILAKYILNSPVEVDLNVNAYYKFIGILTVPVMQWYFCFRFGSTNSSVQDILTI